MKTKSVYKSGDHLDTIMNVLLFVLAIGVLGLGAWEVQTQPFNRTASNQQQA